ncbi:MAG: Na/Pi cotransporter family protein [Phycisphaerae bacterium]|nr:Na/Pi cotransporter family protein [Phycisphaerae bacterium]
MPALAKQYPTLGVSMNITVIIGGLALFLYGMGLMSDGLKRAAGDRLRTMLGRVTRYRLSGMAMGAGVTCLIQSSSATTVIVVGLINAGLLTLAQAVSVVLGANIGTTITSWLVSFIVGLPALKISAYALPFIAAGFGLTTFGRRRRTKNIGQIILGFGLLFLGLDFMKDGMGDLADKKASPLIALIRAIGDRPLLAVLAGAGFTMAIQSSSASIAMVIVAMTQTAQFSEHPSEALRIAIPFILGDNIGTTITAQLAALRTNINGKRAAMAHTLFNVIGVAVVLPLVYIGVYPQLVEWLYPGPLTGATLAYHISVAHTAFNLTAALVVLPFVGSVARLVTWMLPGRQTPEALQPVTLEEHLVDTPSLAMPLIRTETVRMLKTAWAAMDTAYAAIQEDKPKLIDEVSAKEDATDKFQTSITRYLVSLSRRPLEDETANELPVLMHSVNDIERMGDHAMNIAEIAVRKFENGHRFSDDAEAECRRMYDRVGVMFDHVLTAVEHGDRAAAACALEDEGSINEMDERFRETQIVRMSEGRCHALAGLIFTDYVHNMEKIGDHLANIAQGILGGGQWGEQQKLQQQAEETDAGIYRPHADETAADEPDEDSASAAMADE